MAKSILQMADEELNKWETERASRGRYPALRSIAGWFVFLSWVVWIFGVVCLLAGAAMAIYSYGHSQIQAALSAGGSLWAFLVNASWALFLRARGEEIYVRIDTEKNTRDTAELLGRRIKA